MGMEGVLWALASPPKGEDSKAALPFQALMSKINSQIASAK